MDELRNMDHNMNGCDLHKHFQLQIMMHNI